MSDPREPLEQFRAYYTRTQAAGNQEEAIKLAGREAGLYTMLRLAFYAGYEARSAEVKAPTDELERMKKGIEELIEAASSLMEPWKERMWLTPGGRARNWAEKAVAAGRGGGKDSLDRLVEAVPEPAQGLPPLPNLPAPPAVPGLARDPAQIVPWDLPVPPQVDWSKHPDFSKYAERPPVHHQGGNLPAGYQFGPPPVTRIEDYVTEQPTAGASYSGAGIVSAYMATKDRIQGATCPSCQSADQTIRLPVRAFADGKPTVCANPWHEGRNPEDEA